MVFSGPGPISKYMDGLWAVLSHKLPDGSEKPVGLYLDLYQMLKGSTHGLKGKP